MTPTAATLTPPIQWCNTQNSLNRTHCAVTLDQGQAVIWPTRYRPGSGTRGYHRITMHHGVSVLRSGRRHAFGVIFDDAT